MIVTISGKAGSGKSTVAKLLSERLKLKHYSIGDLMRVMAMEKRITLLELNKLAEKDKSIDFELDNKLKEMGNTKDNFVVDGRLTAFFIPNADVRVFLDADDQIRAERILKDRRQQEKNKDMDEAINNIKKREESEKKRYQKYYGINYFDKKLYNYVIDTTQLTPEQVVGQVVKFVNSKKGIGRSSGGK
ncbi:(d)CMP kinase [Candidatus Woesearchaeota archaeon]|nr:(d)CMP kinase [Candidatus Woesearchaeota archaeon]